MTVSKSIKYIMGHHTMKCHLCLNCGTKEKKKKYIIKIYKNLFNPFSLIFSPLLAFSLHIPHATT